jgi:hypothetical protein
VLEVGACVRGPVRVRTAYLRDPVDPGTTAVLDVVPGQEVEVVGREEAVRLNDTDPRRDGEGRLPVDEDVAQVEDDSCGRDAYAQRSEAGTKSRPRSPV